VDEFREVSSQSWLSRMKGAISGVLVGIVLVPGSIWLLSWNEGRSVQTYRSLSEGAGAIRSVKPETVDRAMEGRIVHLSGRMTTGGRVGDPTFGISAKAVRLVRTAEMYQWQEKRESRTRDKVGGGRETVTTYSYRRTWSSKLIDSSRFRRPSGHRNPAQMRVSSRQWVAERVTVGAYLLPRSLVTRVGGAREIPVTPQLAQGMARRAGVEGRSIDGKFYIGFEPSRPRIGDVRVGFSAIPQQPVSLVARQTGNSFAPYQTKAGDKLFMITAGIVTSQAMFKQAEKTNSLITWLIRAGGTLAMFIAFLMILRPITMLGAVLPILSQLVAFGTGLIAFVLTVLIAPLTIAIAWFAVRPLLAAIVLAVGVAIGFATFMLLKSRRRQPAPAMAGGGTTEPPPAAQADKNSGWDGERPADAGEGGWDRKPAPKRPRRKPMFSRNKDKE